MRPKVRYEIEELPPSTKRTVVENLYNPKTKKMELRQRTISGGFLVFFAQRHSTFFETRELMEQAGVEAHSAVFDMDTGMPVPPEIAAMYDTSLRAQVERNTQIVPPSQRGQVRDPVAQSIADGE